MSYGHINFSKLLKIKENTYCFDCSKHHVEWCSITNGIFICTQCAGEHRGFGRQTSFVKSCVLDIWKSNFIDFIIKGGNKRLFVLLNFYGIEINGYSNNRQKLYDTCLLKSYRELLGSEVNNKTNKTYFPLSTECFMNDIISNIIYFDYSNTAFMLEENNLNKNNTSISKENVINEIDGLNLWYQQFINNMSDFNGSNTSNSISKSFNLNASIAKETSITLNNKSSKMNTSSSFTIKKPKLLENSNQNNDIKIPSLLNSSSNNEDEFIEVNEENNVYSENPNIYFSGYECNNETITKTNINKSAKSGLLKLFNKIN